MCMCIIMSIIIIITMSISIIIFSSSSSSSSSSSIIIIIIMNIVNIINSEGAPFLWGPTGAGRGSPLWRRAPPWRAPPGPAAASPSRTSLTLPLVCYTASLYCDVSCSYDETYGHAIADHALTTCRKHLFALPQEKGCRAAEAALHLLIWCSDSLSSQVPSPVEFFCCGHLWYTVKGLKYSEHACKRGLTLKEKHRFQLC